MADRRHFLKTTTVAAFAASLPGISQAQSERLFSVSLAQWSLNKRLFSGELSNLDFPVFTRNEFGIGAVEYVNQFWMDKAEDSAYLAQLKQRCDDHGVQSVLIMCDREGALGDPDNKARTTAIENHYKWVTAAATLGCHSIRVNAQSEGSYGQQLDLAVDGLGRLCEFAEDHGLNVIVENHGGLSSNGKWLAAVMEQVNKPNCGTLPDFGNFYITREEFYNHYLGVKELMPYARGVSAKSYDFNDSGEETRTDFTRMMQIVLDAGYRGHVGVEWEGRELDDVTGIRMTRDLLLRVRDELAYRYL